MIGPSFGAVLRVVAGLEVAEVAAITGKRPRHGRAAAVRPLPPEDAPRGRAGPGPGPTALHAGPEPAPFRPGPGPPGGPQSGAAGGFGVAGGTGELRPATAPVTGGPAPALPSGGDRPPVRHGRRIASPGGDPGHEARPGEHGQPSRARPPRAGKDKPSKAEPPKGEPGKGNAPRHESAEAGPGASGNRGGGRK